MRPKNALLSKFSGIPNTSKDVNFLLKKLGVSLLLRLSCPCNRLQQHSSSYEKLIATNMYVYYCYKPQNISKKATHACELILLPSRRRKRFCPGVPVHKGITIVLSLFRSHWLAVVYCLVFCIGSCEPIHEDRTKKTVFRSRTFSSKKNTLTNQFPFSD